MFPGTSCHKIGFGLVAILALTFFPQQLKADFIPPYGVPTQTYFIRTYATPQVFVAGSWTISTSGTDLSTYANSYASTSPSEVIFDTGITTEEGFRPELSIAMTTAIVASGMLSFDYSLNLFSTNPNLNYGAYTLDGTVFQLRPGNGSVDIPVTVGESFGFLASANSKCITCVPAFAGGTKLTITHFIAPVPEPSVLLLSCAGAVTMVAGRIRRRLRFRGSGRSVSR